MPVFPASYEDAIVHVTASEEKDREAQRRAAAKNVARKPSAILEEIEGMFGTPDFTIE